MRLVQTIIFAVLLLSTYSKADLLEDKEPFNQTLPLEGEDEMFSQNPNFIGKYGTKNFFCYAATHSQDAARTACRAEGFNLVRFDSRAELDFVNEKAPKDYCWTDAVISNAPTSFTWFSNGDYLTDGFKYQGSIGLTLSKYSSGGVLSSLPSSEPRCYLCYQRGI